MPRTTSLLLVAVALALAAPARGAAQHASYRLADAPERLRPAIGRAEAVMGELQKVLITTLTAQMKMGGAVGALATCHTEAAPIARRVAAESGIRVGRTSSRLRNAGNAAPEWARPFVAGPTSGRAGDAQAVAVDLGDRVGVLRPIATVTLCTTCHGPVDQLAPDVREKLRVLYPQDRAVDFRDGDLRGWMWAEVSITP